MNNEEPKKLSDYLRTENGGKVIEKIGEELKELGDMPARKKGFAYSVLSEALFWLDECCAKCDPGEEGFDMEVTDDLFEADVDSLMADIRGWYSYNEDASDVFSDDADRREFALKQIFWDYRA